MKLIQIVALTGAMAAVATGQTGANSSKPSGQPTPATVAPAPAQSSAPASKPTPATKKAQSKAVPASAKGAAATSKTNGAQAAPAKAAGAAPATKAGSAPPTVPVVSTQTQKTKPSGTAAKPVEAKSMAKTPAAKAPAQKAAPKPAVAASKKSEGKKAASPSKPGKPNVARVEPAPRAEPKPPTPAKLLGAAGRRDPFVSPIRSQTGVAPTSACTSGKRCLNIPELVLQGTVRDITGKMMAVVTTSNRTRTYTLRENDQVFNGSVEKITSDSIIFREYVRDPLGRESAREVVKKLGPTT
jgi:Tfp pilus assembly protein PilP